MPVVRLRLVLPLALLLAAAARLHARLNEPEPAASAVTRPTRKTPPVWPEQLTALLKQNRGGNLSDTTLAYDLPGGRNLNIIHDLQTGAVLWDNERNNGSTYYYYPAQQTCQAVNMHVGILKPDWLAGATYEGVEVVNGHHCDRWAAANRMHEDPPFITYFADVETQRPWRWVFFDGAIFDVLEWTPGGTLSEADWQLPAYCFSQAEVEEEVVAEA